MAISMVSIKYEIATQSPQGEEEAERKGEFSGKSFKERNLEDEGLVGRDSEKDSYASGAWIRRG